MNWEGFGTKQTSPIRGTIPACLKKKPSARKANAPAEVRIGHLTNIKSALPLHQLIQVAGTYRAAWREETCQFPFLLYII
jgi:hypothetical protein